MLAPRLGTCAAAAVMSDDTQALNSMCYTVRTSRHLNVANHCGCVLSHCRTQHPMSPVGPDSCWLMGPWTAARG